MVLGSKVERGIDQLVEYRLRVYWPKWPSGCAQLRLPNTCASRGDLQVFDARGNLVQAHRLGLYGENRLDLDLGNAAPGLYLVRLT